MIERPEVWLRGPISGVPSLLQPVAHALMQAAEEVDALMRDFPEAQLWSRPAGVASAGFHLQHLAGILDRLCSYASGVPLTEAQLEFLAKEGQTGSGKRELIAAFHAQLEQTIRYLQRVEVETLSEYRVVGRSQLPSSVLGLLFHAAEHTQRHVGQLLVTVRVQRNSTDVAG